MDSYFFESIAYFLPADIAEVLQLNDRFYQAMFNNDIESLKLVFENTTDAHCLLVWIAYIYYI